MSSVEEEYQEAIAFFQKYPDIWKKLLNGILAKRNRGYDETARAALDPHFVDREKVITNIMVMGAAFDEVARDFVGEYSETEEYAEEEDTEE